MSGPEHDPGNEREGVAKTPLTASILEILAAECLPPDEILTRLQTEHPDLTLDRVLVTLYQNAAIFRRRHGAWCAGAHPRMSHARSKMVS